MKTVKLPGPELGAALAHVRHCCIKNETRKNLMGVHLVACGGMLTVEATDGHRLARWSTKAGPKSADVEAILRLDTVARLIERATAVRGGTVTVNIPTGVFPNEAEADAAGCLPGRFPHMEHVIPRDGDSTGRLTVPTVELRAALRIVSRMSGEKIKPAKLTINGAVTLESERAEYGNVECDLPGASWDGAADLRIGFHAAYLIEAIKNAGASVTLAMGDALRPIRVDFPGVPELVQVVMPLRIEW